MALLWTEDFNRADASGFAAVGNGWAVAGGDINIVSNALQRTGSGYCISYNPTSETLPEDLRLEVDVIVAGGEGSTAEWFGIAVKYDESTGDGIKILLQAWDADTESEFRIGTSANHFDNVTTTLDASVPVSGWAADGTHTLALEIVGSLCSVYFDGDLIAHGTYTPSTPGTNIALVGDPGGSDLTIDAIRVYSLDDAAAVTAFATASAMATATAGKVSVTAGTSSAIGTTAVTATKTATAGGASSANASTTTTATKVSAASSTAPAIASATASAAKTAIATSISAAMASGTLAAITKTVPVSAASPGIAASTAISRKIVYISAVCSAISASYRTVQASTDIIRPDLGLVLRPDLGLVLRP